jgi:hypothetical protein
VPEKGSNLGVFKISTKLAAILTNLPKKSEKIFGYRNVRYLERLFRQKRARAAQKLETHGSNKSTLTRCAIGRQRWSTQKPKTCCT